MLILSLVCQFYTYNRMLVSCITNFGQCWFWDVNFVRCNFLISTDWWWAQMAMAYPLHVGKPTHHVGKLTREGSVPNFLNFPNLPRSTEFLDIILYNNDLTIPKTWEAHLCHFNHAVTLPDNEVLANPKTISPGHFLSSFSCTPSPSCLVICIL